MSYTHRHLLRLTTALTICAAFAAARAVDVKPPVIDHLHPLDQQIVPLGTFAIEIGYHDDQSSIDSASATLSLQAWSGATRGADVAPSRINWSSSAVTQTGAVYPASELAAGRYLMTFSIADVSGNTRTTSVDFLVDEIYFNVSAASLALEVPAMETLATGTVELTLTVRTIGAGFRVVMIRSSPFLSSSGTLLPDRTGSSGIAYGLAPYTSPLTAFQSETTVMNIPPETLPDGSLHEHQTSLRLAAFVDQQQSPESYISSLSFRIEIDYTDRSTCIFANSHFACHL